jgi:hypothetical protein
MPTNANTPDQRSDRYARYIQVGPTPATHLSRWVHPNGTTKSHPPPSIVKALTPSQLADTPSSALPHNHAHLGRAPLAHLRHADARDGPGPEGGPEAPRPLERLVTMGIYSHVISEMCLEAAKVIEDLLGYRSLGQTITVSTLILSPTMVLTITATITLGESRRV